MGATRMACPEPAMETEQRYLSALAGASRYSFLADRLVLSCDTEEGPVALIFTPREDSPPVSQ
jgi:heat shock protein HslJ